MTFLEFRLNSAIFKGSLEGVPTHHPILASFFSPNFFFCLLLILRVCANCTSVCNGYWTHSKKNVVGFCRSPAIKTKNCSGSDRELSENENFKKKRKKTETKQQFAVEKSHLRWSRVKSVALLGTVWSAIPDTITTARTLKKKNTTTSVNLIRDKATKKCWKKSE